MCEWISIPFYYMNIIKITDWMWLVYLLKLDWMSNGLFDKICINMIQNKGNYMISNMGIIF